MFGYNLFTAVPSTFAQADRIPVTTDYIVGPGDEILIRAWGQIDIDARVEVDRSGDIFVAKVGTLHVAGLRYDQLQDYLKTGIGRIYQKFDLTVNMGHLRSIQVFVVGHAYRPGAYTISSLSTLVNALFACGGPAPTGSMRHIQLKRNAKMIADFDIYDLLLNGDKSKDMQLSQGDVIFIPPVGSLVAIDGSVNVPAVYELNGAGTLDAVIELAGGLTNVASGQRATVERIYDRATRKVEQFPLDSAGLARAIQDGDLIMIYPLSPKFENAVTLRGTVAKPGRYPWTPGMRVRDLVPARELLITSEYWMRQNRAARNKDVRTVPDVNWSYAVISRINPQDLSTLLIPFNLGKAIDGDTSENVELETGDVITIYSQADVRVPVEERSTFVRLEGEIKRPGLYRVGAGETLKRLVARAGGLTPQAYVFASQFTRESTRTEQQSRLDEMMQQLQRDSERNAVLQSVRKSGPEQNNEFTTRLQYQQAMLGAMRQLKATGRIVLGLRPSDKSIDSLPNIALEDGDRFFVPNYSSSLSVVGDVVNPSTFLYYPNKRVSRYLRDAGGATRFADQSRTFVLRADGSIISKKTSSNLWSNSFDDLQLMPGDAIVVPQHLPRAGFVAGLKDWTQILAQFGLGAAAVHVLSQQ